MFHSEPVTRNVVKKMMAFHTRKHVSESEQEKLDGEKEFNAILSSSATAEDRKFYFSFAKTSFVTFAFLGFFISFAINILNKCFLGFSPYLSFVAFLLFCLPVGIIATLHFKERKVTADSSYSTLDLFTGLVLGTLLAGVITYWWHMSLS